MKNNIDYYQHFAYADQHPKFKMLRVQFGWAGEGKFWALNNKIAQAEDCCLDVSKKYNRAAIASDLDFSMDELDEFLTFLLEDCELIRKCPEGKITTDIIQECFTKVMSDREKARERASRRWEKQTDTSPEKDEVSPEKVCKVKESKVNNKDLSSSADEVGADGVDFLMTKKKRKLCGKRFQSFCLFWEAFAYKKGKREAADAWYEIPSLTNGLVEQILKSAADEAAGRKKLIESGKTPKMAQGWISGYRWEDQTDVEPITEKIYPDIKGLT